ncbi:MAG: hypothetical protein WCC66_08305 [Rhizobiaceae bacterium]
MNRIIPIISMAVTLAASGCAKDDTLRTEGLTLGAGDAMARNTALQIIDPWPAGVEDTDLDTPNDRGGVDGDGTTPAGGGAPATTAPGGAQ